MPPGRRRCFSLPLYAQYGGERRADVTKCARRLVMPPPSCRRSAPAHAAALMMPIAATRWLATTERRLIGRLCAADGCLAADRRASMRIGQEARRWHARMLSFLSAPAYIRSDDAERQPMAARLGGFRRAGRPTYNAEARRSRRRVIYVGLAIRLMGTMARRAHDAGILLVRRSGASISRCLADAVDACCWAARSVASRRVSAGQ